MRNRIFFLLFVLCSSAAATYVMRSRASLAQDSVDGVKWPISEHVSERLAELPETLIPSDRFETLKETAAILDVDSSLLFGKVLSEEDRERLYRLRQHPLVLADIALAHDIRYVIGKEKSLRDAVVSSSDPLVLTKEEFLGHFPDQRTIIEAAESNAVEAVRSVSELVNAEVLEQTTEKDD